MKVIVTGSGGLIGRHVCEVLGARGHVPIPFVGDLLRDNGHFPIAEAVVHCAGMVGGIQLNRDRPADLMSANIRMLDNSLSMALRAGVRRFVNLGSVCAYKALDQIAYDPEMLWEGRPEESNAPYGIAKRVGMEMVDAYGKQYGIEGVNLILANIYGPGAKTGQLAHVIPALIDRFLNAKERGMNVVEVWGNGKAQREFLYVEDAANLIIDNGIGVFPVGPVNVGSGQVIEIKDLADIIAESVGFQGVIQFNPAMPDSTTRRQLRTGGNVLLYQFTPLAEGIRRTVQSMKDERSKRTVTVS